MIMKHIGKFIVNLEQIVYIDYEIQEDAKIKTLINMSNGKVLEHCFKSEVELINLIKGSTKAKVCSLVYNWFKDLIRKVKGEKDDNRWK